MELWTEYEGRTIDGLFPLTKLLRPEGRSAFFLTSNGNGVPRVIRLIEPHFDEDEILARWRGVAALNHPNILKLEKFGQVDLEGGSFLYAVMEPVEANLGEVVVQQRLSVPEARQLAESLISALDCLHSHGFVHEHLEPDHIYAVGETVKLRSDCIREAPEDEEGQQLKRRDVHDFSVVVLQALTRQKTLEAAAQDLPLPAPLDRIVRNGMNGQWGVTQISAALKGDVPTGNVPAAPPVSPAPINPSPASVAQSAPEKVELPSSPSRVYVPLDDDEPSHARSAVFPGMQWVVIGLVAVLLLWLGWHFLSSRPANQATSQPVAATPAPVPAPDTSVAKPTPSSSAPLPVAHPSATPKHLPPDTRDQWRVIAYTYNHQDQAQHKVDTVARMHPDLQPEVFSPSGRAPYLVAIGGFMSRDDAFALAQKVRSEGLPHDTYAQNYTGKGR